MKKRLGSIKGELQKSFPTADTLPEKTPDHLEPENPAHKCHSEENVHDELQRSVKTPSNLQRKVAFCPPGRRRAPLLRCNMSDLKSVMRPPLAPDWRELSSRRSNACVPQHSYAYLFNRASKNRSVSGKP